jgi:predicted membrane channel-forming protein YqfA (hemolysin III family)
MFFIWRGSTKKERRNLPTLQSKVMVVGVFLYLCGFILFFCLAKTQFSEKKEKHM